MYGGMLILDHPLFSDLIPIIFAEIFYFKTYIDCDIHSTILIVSNATIIQQVKIREIITVAEVLLK